MLYCDSRNRRGNGDSVNHTGYVESRALVHKRPGGGAPGLLHPPPLPKENVRTCSLICALTGSTVPPTSLKRHGDRGTVITELCSGLDASQNGIDLWKLNAMVSALRFSLARRLM